jgi:hypothetical protein
VGTFGKITLEKILCYCLIKGLRSSGKNNIIIQRNDKQSFSVELYHRAKAVNKKENVIFQPADNIYVIIHDNIFVIIHQNVITHLIIAIPDFGARFP